MCKQFTFGVGANSMAEKDVALKERIVSSLDALSSESLAEVASFVAYQQHRQVLQPGDESKPVPVALGGIWAGVEITDEDIEAVRREMWEGFGERDL